MIRRVGLIATALLLGGCGDPPVDPIVRPTVFDGSWSQPVSHLVTLVHDGAPVSTDNFIVYSEASSPEARAHVGTIAEGVYAELLDQLDVGRADFDFLPSYAEEKIHILADYNQWNRSGWAYRDGLIMRATDSPRYAAVGYTPEWYRRVMHHEVMHVVEFLLIGDPGRSHMNSVWLREGFANWVAGPGPNTVTRPEQVDSWQARMAGVPGGGNPIEILFWTDFPPEVLSTNRTIEYYAFFELATRWLLDPEGHGGTIEELKLLYDDLGEGKSFQQALNDRFRLNLNYLRENYFTLMREYLAATGAP